MYGDCRASLCFKGKLANKYARGIQQRERAEVAAGVWEGPWKWQHMAESADIYLNAIVPQTLGAELFLLCVWQNVHNIYPFTV